MRQYASGNKKRVMISCPNTGRTVFTGFEFTKSPQYSTFVSSAVHFPHCKSSHTWDSDIAFLEANELVES